MCSFMQQGARIKPCYHLLGFLYSAMVMPLLLFALEFCFSLCFFPNFLVSLPGCAFVQLALLVSVARYACLSSRSHSCLLDRTSLLCQNILYSVADGNMPWFSLSYLLGFCKPFFPVCISPMYLALACVLQPNNLQPPPPAFLC